MAKVKVLVFDKKGNHLPHEDFWTDGNYIPKASEKILPNEPTTFYKPKLIDGEIVEVATQEELDERMNTPSMPTQLEIMQECVIELDYRLVLMELGFM